MLHKMKKILFLILCVPLLVSCDDLLSQIENLIPNDNDAQVYNIDASSLNGWDIGFATEKCYTVLYKDSATNELHMYINERDANDDKGLIIICNQKLEITSLGTTKGLYSLDCSDSDIRLWRLNNENVLEEHYVPYSSNTRAISPPSLSQINNVLSAVSTTTAGGQGLYQLTQGDWGGFLETLKQAGVDFGAGKLLGKAPLLGIAYTYLRGSYDYYRWNEARRQRKALYAECYPEITEVANDSQGDCLVFVDIHNKNTLADYLFDFYNKTESDITRNKVYCGVVIREVFTPTYHNHTYISSLVCLNGEVDYGENLMFMLPALGQHIYQVTPFLLSSRVFDKNNNIGEEYILYGESYTYYPSSEFEALKKIYEKTNGENWTNKENWLSGRPLNEWYGITLDEKGFVKSIDLQNNNLTGELSINSSSFVHLSNININDNALERLSINHERLQHIELSNCIVNYGSISIENTELITIKDIKQLGKLSINCQTLIVDNCDFGETGTPFSSVNAESVLIRNSTMYNCGLNNDYLEFENSKTTNTWHCVTRKRARLINSYCSVICSWDFYDDAQIIVSNTTLIQPEWNADKTGTYSFTTNSAGWANMFSE